MSKNNIQVIDIKRLYDELCNKYLTYNFGSIVDSKFSFSSLRIFFEQYMGAMDFKIWNRDDWELIEYGHKAINPKRFLSFIYGITSYESESWYIIANSDYQTWDSRIAFKIEGKDWLYFIDEYYPLSFGNSFLQREDYLILSTDLNRFYVMYSNGATFRADFNLRSYLE